MPDPIRQTSATVPARKPTTKPAAPAAANVMGKFDADVFDRKAPTKAELDGHRAAIAALDALPRLPLGREAKREWLAAVAPKLEAAEKALRGLEDAEFWHKAVSATESDAARDKVWKLRNKVDSAKEAAGLVAPTKPASPIRPLFGLTDACKDMMGRNAFLAIIGILMIIPATVIDIVDLVTRPLQALAYPFLWGQYKARDIQYDRENKAPAAKP